MKNIQLHAEVYSYALFLNDITGRPIDECSELLKRWYEPWRFYHNQDHLLNILRKIRKSNLDNQTETEYILAAIFHDIVYLPWASDNEFASEVIMESFCENINKEVLEKVSRLIQCTESRKMPTDPYLRGFWIMDNDVLLKPTIKGLLDYEAKIRKEFQYVSYDVYKTHRLEFIKKWVDLNKDEIGDNILFKLDMLGSYIEQYVPKIGIYAGSFNPFHIGHLNILEKAEQVFDKVIIAVGKNTQKSEHVENTKQITNSLVYREVCYFNNTLTEFIDTVSKYSDAHLIRGLRNGHDLNYEQNQLWFLNKLSDNPIKTTFFVCDEGLEHISSSALRSLNNIESEKSQEVYNNLIA
jgi:pantetheine-phosphate adenylyltransferase